MGLPASKDRVRVPVRHDHTAGITVAGRAAGAPVFQDPFPLNCLSVVRTRGAFRDARPGLRSVRHSFSRRTHHHSQTPHRN